MPTSKIRKTARVVKTKQAKPKKEGIEVPFYASTGDKKGTSFLSKELFGQEPNKALMAQTVRVYLSNQRTAQAKTKGRGEVDRTKRKPYRQKGTGHARHGSKSAPLFVGGGIAHGPRGDRNYRLGLPRGMRRKALVSALSAKARSASILVADLDALEAKTKTLARFLQRIGVPRPVVLVHKDSANLVRAGRNIKGVTLVPVTQLNTYQVLMARSLVLTETAVESMK